MCSKNILVSDLNCNKSVHREICGEYTIFQINRLVGKPLYRNLNVPEIILRPTKHFWIIENLSDSKSVAISMNSNSCPYTENNKWHVYKNNQVSISHEQ